MLFLFYVLLQNIFFVPSSDEKVVLQNAGLGKKKIKVNMFDLEEDVFKKLTISAKKDGGENVRVSLTEGCGGLSCLHA